MPPGGSTCAEPPPEIMPTSACPPITATLRILGVQRQDRLLILQQHDALLFHMLGESKPALDIDDAFLDGIVHHARKKLGVKNAARMVIDLSHRHLAVFDRFFSAGPK